MNDAHTPTTDPADDVNALDVMLALADRELRFLTDHFAACGEIAGSTSGGEFIDALGIAALALTRLRLERQAPPSTLADHGALHDAIAVLKRDQT